MKRTTGTRAAAPSLTHFGVYRVERLLGMGRLGEVFLAWDARLRRHVAIKRFRADLALDDDHRARFRQEARAVARLNHPAIVQIYDIVELAAGDAIVLEYVTGLSLRELIARGALGWMMTVSLGAEIAAALATAHAQGFIIDDLEPENVIVTPSGHAKLLELGLLRVLRHDREPADPRSDLFALGCLLYEMATGRAPFRGGGPVTAPWQMTAEEPPPVTELAPWVPTALAGLITRLLVRDPARRPSEAGQVVAELAAIATRPCRGSYTALPARGRDRVAEMTVLASPAVRESEGRDVGLALALELG